MPDNLTDIAKGLADVMKRRFTPPEFIPGCKVVNVDDVDQYAANNGWIEAICGQHNQQRCRWRGQYASIAVDDYVDVMYFPDRRLFEVHRQGGSGAVAATGNVIGPGSSTDNAIARFDGTAGYTLQDSGVTVDVSDNISTAGDIFPQSSTYGLNARFERLFGDDVPANPYQFILPQFIVDDEANNKLGFETDTTSGTDSYNPSSPFSKSNTGTVAFYANKHHLYIDTQAAGPAQLIWTDATAKNEIITTVQFSVRYGTTYSSEIRLHAVQTPGASDNYWAIRFIKDATTYPDWPWRIKLFKGTGITYSISDGTEISNAPWDVGKPYKVNFYLSAGGRCRVSISDIFGKPIIGLFRADTIFDITDASYPANFKTATIYVSGTFQRMAIDSVAVI